LSMVDARGVRSQIAADFSLAIGGMSEKLTVTGRMQLPN
jgi:hypothetical protein